MWPPTESVVAYRLVGECHSCGRDLPATLPRLPVADPDALLDVELLALWRVWSQMYHRAGGLPGEPSLVAEFRQWLTTGTVDEPPEITTEEWEHAFLHEFRRPSPVPSS